MSEMTPQRQMALMKARAIARYKLTAVPGRPEELIRPEGDGLSVGVSFGYGCRSIRVRKMHGRTWTDHLDFQIEEGWTPVLCHFLDAHFGFVQPQVRATPLDVARRNSPHPMDSFPTHIDGSRLK